MKAIFLTLLFILSHSLPSFAEEVSGDKPAVVTVGLLPGGEPEALRKQGQIFGELLQDELGVPVQIYIPKSYSGLQEALKNKKVDFAFMSALSYVNAEKEVPLKVLLKKVWNTPFYYSCLVTMARSKVSKVSQIGSHKLVYVDEKSTSGYLYPQSLLLKEKITPKEVVFSGNHAESIRMLESGKADVAAVFCDDEKAQTGAWRKFGKLPAKDYKTIWISAPIPNDPFVVREELYEKYPKFVHELMFKLVDLFEKNMQKKEIKDLLGSQTLMPATSRQFDSVRDLLRSGK